LVFHKSKRFFSESGLDAAQDYAEGRMLNMHSSDYLHTAIEALIEERNHPGVPAKRGRPKETPEVNHCLVSAGQVA